MKLMQNIFHMAAIAGAALAVAGCATDPSMHSSTPSTPPTGLVEAVPYDAHGGEVVRSGGGISPQLTPTSTGGIKTAGKEPFTTTSTPPTVIAEAVPYYVVRSGGGTNRRPTPAPTGGNETHTPPP
jgi:hypothetical protein